MEIDYRKIQPGCREAYQDYTDRLSIGGFTPSATSFVAGWNARDEEVENLRKALKIWDKNGIHRAATDEESNFIKSVMKNFED